MPNSFPKSEMDVNLATRSLPESSGLLVIRGVLLNLLGVGVVLLGLRVIRDIGQLLLVGTYS